MIFAGGFSSYGAGCIYSTYVVVFSSSCPLKTFGPACVPACYSGILQYLYVVVFSSSCPLKTFGPVSLHATAGFLNSAGHATRYSLLVCIELANGNVISHRGIVHMEL